jgi:hypothetical protein
MNSFIVNFSFLVNKFYKLSNINIKTFDYYAYFNHHNIDIQCLDSLAHRNSKKKEKKTIVNILLYIMKNKPSNLEYPIINSHEEYNKI